MPKMDRRVRRTRRRLRNALIELILMHGYDQITIQEVTDHADLSRATFYLHYKDKDELLANSLEEMFDEFVHSVQDLIFRTSLDIEDQHPPSLPAFRHVAEYHELYKSLLGDKGVTSVIYRTLDYIARITRKQLELMAEDHEIQNLPIPIEITAQHVAGSLFAIVSWWLEQDMPHSPEEMARLYHTLTVPGLRGALGISSQNSITTLPGDSPQE